jgi:hypothetical protein
VSAIAKHKKASRPSGDQAGEEPARPKSKASPAQKKPKAGGTGTMLLIREVMYCKPGKVRPMVEKFTAMAKLNEKHGLGKMRVMTDFCAEQYWTIVSEFEVPSMQAFEEMMRGQGLSAEAMKEMETLMKGYHEFVERGRREIYTIEA